MTTDVFAVPVFLVTFRETLETAIIVSVLLAFLKQTLDGPNRNVKVYKALRRQVWLGTIVGLVLCLIIAGIVIGVFYGVGKDSWKAHEYDYEGAFSLIAAVIITIMGAALLRVGRLQEKWRVKLAKAMEAPISAKAGQPWLRRFLEKYAMFILPFVTILREGIEAIVFIAGVSFSAPATAIPLPVVVGLIVGSFVGYLIYKGGSIARVQIFLVISTCFLYLVGAGLFSRSVWYFETQRWNKAIGGDAAELGTGPGSYDIDQSVWHVNCCSPQFNGGGGWGILNAIFGWTNSATYGSVISYNLYWITVITGFFIMRYQETHGHWPLIKAKATKEGVEGERSADESRVGSLPVDGGGDKNGGAANVTDADASP